MNASILNHFESLPDPRIERRKRYPLMEIILLFIAARAKSKLPRHMLEGAYSKELLDVGSE